MNEWFYLCSFTGFWVFMFVFVLRCTGDYDKGVDHLTNAIAVCGQPQQLLQVLQQTLPPPVFQMLLTKLPTISQVNTVSLKLRRNSVT